MQGNDPNAPANDNRYVYLLRCWQESDGRWRYTVEPVDGRAAPRRGFPSRAHLLAYLQSILPEQDLLDKPNGGP